MCKPPKCYLVDAKNTFKNKYNLISLDGVDFRDAINYSSTFYGCAKLTSEEFEKIEFNPNALILNNAFGLCNFEYIPDNILNHISKSEKSLTSPFVNTIIGLVDHIELPCSVSFEGAKIEKIRYINAADEYINMLINSQVSNIGVIYANRSNPLFASTSIATVFGNITPNITALPFCNRSSISIPTSTAISWYVDYIAVDTTSVKQITKRSVEFSGHIETLFDPLVELIDNTNAIQKVDAYDHTFENVKILECTKTKRYDDLTKNISSIDYILQDNKLIANVTFTNIEDDSESTIKNQLFICYEAEIDGMPFLGQTYVDVTLKYTFTVNEDVEIDLMVED